MPTEKKIPTGHRQVLAVEPAIPDDDAVRRPFAASLDLAQMAWQFMGPVASIATTSFLAGPELAIQNAVKSVVEDLIKRTKLTPAELVKAGAQFLHFSGLAAANDLTEGEFAHWVRNYLETAKAKGPGQELIVRPHEGSQIEMRFDSESAPSLSTPQPVEPKKPEAFPHSPFEMIEGFRSQTAPYQARIVVVLQNMLNAWAGKHCPTLDENKSLATALNQLADDHGIALVYEGKPVTLRAVPVRRDPGGTFQTRSARSDQRILKTCMGLPHLIAVPKSQTTIADPESDVKPVAKRRTRRKTS